MAFSCLSRIVSCIESSIVLVIIIATVRVIVTIIQRVGSNGTGYGDSTSSKEY